MRVNHYYIWSWSLVCSKLRGNCNDLSYAFPCIFRWIDPNTVLDLFVNLSLWRWFSISNKNITRQFSLSIVSMPQLEEDEKYSFSSTLSGEIHTPFEGGYIIYSFLVAYLSPSSCIGRPKVNFSVYKRTVYLTLDIMVISLIYMSK